VCATGPCPCLSSREDPAYPSSMGHPTDAELRERGRIADGEAPAQPVEKEKPRRHVVVVDTETTGLREQDITVEVAWWDLDTDERGRFVPKHNVEWVRANAHPDALALNGYEQRISGATQDDGAGVRRLHEVLRGQVLAGSNVRFDAAKLAALFAVWGLAREPWFYHLAELGPYAAGVLGVPLWDMPGLSGTCALLDIPPGDHTAEADVTATGLAFRTLMARTAVTV
jgi:hypothetical protein